MLRKEGLTAPNYPAQTERRAAFYLSEGELLSIWLDGGYDYHIENNLKFTFEPAQSALPINLTL